MDSGDLIRRFERDARDAVRLADEEAKRLGWSMAELTDRQAQYLFTRATLEVATWAAEEELTAEMARAGDRFNEVFRARRPQSEALRELLPKLEPVEP